MKMRGGIFLRRRRPWDRTPGQRDRRLTAHPGHHMVRWPQVDSRPVRHDKIRSSAAVATLACWPPLVAAAARDHAAGSWLGTCGIGPELRVRPPRRHDDPGLRQGRVPARLGPDLRQSVRPAPDQGLGHGDQAQRAGRRGARVLVSAVPDRRCATDHGAGRRRGVDRPLHAHGKRPAHDPIPGASRLGSGRVFQCVAIRGHASGRGRQGLHPDLEPRPRLLRLVAHRPDVPRPGPEHRFPAVPAM